MRVFTYLTGSVAGLVAMTSAALAGQCGYDRCWGAVAAGPNGAFSYSFSHITERDAADVATQGCVGGCTVVRTFYNSCGAIAWAENGAWGWASDRSRGAAESRALAFCAESGAQCDIRVWACSP